MAEMADVHIHRKTKRRSSDLHADELPCLTPLPENPRRHLTHFGHIDRRIEAAQSGQVKKGSFDATGPRGRFDYIMAGDG